jgi:hypothetical protein
MEIVFKLWPYRVIAPYMERLYGVICLSGLLYMVSGSFRSSIWRRSALYVDPQPYSAPARDYSFFVLYKRAQCTAKL